MSMPEVHAPTKATDPAAIDPTITANEASQDPIRSTGTETLSPESRPEVINNTTPTNTGGDGLGSTESGGLTAPKGSTVVEAQPINDGILNYKAPGLLKGLFVSKKFFWFGDEPLEHKQLSNYLSSEKPDIAHRNAAHATQTGKGLLCFAKRAEDKGHPAGIFNLGEITDFTKGTFDEFHFTVHGQKHTFQAPSRAERDGWVVAIETKSQEAKAAHEGIVGSSGYKSQLDRFAKPAGAVAGNTTKSRSRSRPNKITDSKTKEAPVAGAAAGTTTTGVAGEEPTRSGSSSDEAKTKSKSRSQSGKRSSIFGTLRAKKDEHDVKKEIKKEEIAEKKEEKAEEKAEKKAEKEEIKAEETEGTKGTTTSATLDAAGIAARVIGSPVEPTSATEPSALDTTGLTNGETAAIGTNGATGTTGLTGPSNSTTTEPTTSSTARETGPKSAKRTSIFGNFFNKKDTTSPTSPSTEAAPAVPAKDLEAAGPSPAAPQLENPVNSSTLDTTAAPTTTSTEPSSHVPESTTSPTALDSKPARRSSFFNTLGTKKERKADATSDAEGTDGEGRKPSKFGGLFRKPSRAVPNGKTAATESSTPGTEALKASAEPPAPISKEAPMTSNDTENAPESVTTGHTQTPVQATA